MPKPPAKLPGAVLPAPPPPPPTKSAIRRDLACETWTGIPAIPAPDAWVTNMDDHKWVGIMCCTPYTSGPECVGGIQSITSLAGAHHVVCVCDLTVSNNNVWVDVQVSSRPFLLSAQVSSLSPTIGPLQVHIKINIKDQHCHGVVADAQKGLPAMLHTWPGRPKEIRKKPAGGNTCFLFAFDQIKRNYKDGGRGRSCLHSLRMHAGARENIDLRSIKKDNGDVLYRTAVRCHHRRDWIAPRPPS